MTHKPTRPGSRRIKSHQIYNITEAAERCGVCTNTIRNWLGRGLPSVHARGEILILGEDLKDFIRKADRARKQPCPRGGMFCFRCRSPQIPPPELVEVAGVGVSIDLRGMCPNCGCLMHRKVGRTTLEQTGFAQQIAKVANHLADSDQPSLN